MKLSVLRQVLMLYRMMFSQPGPQNLIAQLGAQLPDLDDPYVAEALRIDLGPP